MIRILAAAAIAVLALACGSTAREMDGQAGAAGAMDTTPSAAPTPGGPIGTPAPDWTRVTNDHEGQSIDAPKSWFGQPVTPFGYGGHGITSYDPATSSIPLKTGMNVNVQLMWDWNGDATDLRTFAERRVWIATCVACRKVLETRHLTLAGQDVDFYAVEQNQPHPFDELEPRLFWLLKSPYFADRVLVIQAAPGASPLRATVEQMVSTLQLFKPAGPDLTPTQTRQRVIDEFRAGDGTVTRVEAKLMRWRDWEAAYNAVLRARSAVSGGPSAAHGGNDPDVLVWVVAVTGTFYELRVGPPPGPGSVGPPGANVAPAPTPRQMHWRISVVPAREPYTWGGPSEGGPELTWPIWFDQLIDLDRQRRFAASSRVFARLCAAAAGTSLVFQNVKRMRQWRFHLAHLPETVPHGLRVRVDGRVVAYTGDTDWCDALPRLADGADLFIAEAYSFEKRMPQHLSQTTLLAHRGSIS